MRFENWIACVCVCVLFTHVSLEFELCGVCVWGWARARLPSSSAIHYIFTPISKADM